jgi:cbb3-type cytochrome oxidase maturation protein
MNILFPILILSLVVAVGFLIAFFWAVRSGQYEDDYTPAMRILFEESDRKQETEE